MRLYSVEFKFTKGYGDPKNEGFMAISLVVCADTQFAALSLAWDRLSSLNLPEPTSFNAQVLGKD